MRSRAWIVVVTAALAGCQSERAEETGGGSAGAAEAGAPAPSDAPTPYVLDHIIERIDGSPQSLEAYRGKVLLVVNVASKCGLTPQYEGLQALYERKHGQGLEILAFPANDFRGQEPGTNEEIAAFCSQTYGVTFPLFAKITVVGESKHPLYGELSRVGGEPTWNFTKYLVDKEGRVVARFDPRTPPDDPALLAKIEELLAG